VGKTCWIKRILGGEFNPDYTCTLGSVETTATFTFADGRPLEITFLDTAGVGGPHPLYDAYYQGADAAIIMFDCTCRNTYKGVSAWYDAFTRVCGYDIPVVVVGNKAEPGRKVMPRHITFPFNNNLPYYDMSIKRNSCVEMPLTLLVFWFESKVAMQQLHQFRLFSESQRMVPQPRLS